MEQIMNINPWSGTKARFSKFSGSLRKRVLSLSVGRDVVPEGGGCDRKGTLPRSRNVAMFNGGNDGFKHPAIPL